MNDKDEQHHNSCLQVGVVPEKQVEVETQIPEEVSVVQPPGGSWLEANDLINKKKRASVNKNNNDSDDMMAIEEEPESKKKEKRDRLFLLLFSALTTCFFVGAALGWGPMQLMVRNITPAEMLKEEQASPHQHSGSNVCVFRLIGIILPAGIQRILFWTVLNSGY